MTKNNDFNNTENERYCVRAGYWHNYTGIGRCKDENLTTNEVCDLINQLNYENEQLKEELEQCKAVINNRWSEYLKKKGVARMTEKKVIETQYGWYQKNDDKVNVDEIIGIVKTDEQTNSVQLKKEAQLSICEKRVLELEKENEELKQSINQLKIQNSRFMQEVAEYSRKSKELEKENEQLKQENKELQKYLGWQNMELEEMEDLND